MKIKIFIRFISLIFITWFPGQCNLSFVDPVKLKVITSQAGFDGYYVVDGGDITYFSGSVLTNGVASYEKTFDTMQHAEVWVTTRAGASSIDIQVFRQDNKVKEVLQQGLSQSTTVNFSYKYGEETTTNPATAP